VNVPQFEKILIQAYLLPAQNFLPDFNQMRLGFGTGGPVRRPLRLRFSQRHLLEGAPIDLAVGCQRQLINEENVGRNA
jgi:hypothetical protein